MKNRKPDLWIPIVLILALSTALTITYGYLKSTGFNADRHVRLIDDFRSLEKLDHELNEYVFRSRSHVLLNYDPFIRIFSDVDRRVAELTEMVPTLVEGDKSDIGDALIAFRDLFAKKRALVETFKGQNAILKNSLYYVSLFKLQAHQIGGQLVYSVLRYNTPSGREFRGTVVSSIDEVQAVVDRGPASRVGSLRTLAIHARKIVSQRDAIEKVVAEIDSVESQKQLLAFYASYVSLYQANERDIGRARQLLYLLAVLLIGSVLFSILRLRWSNASLETTVRERSRVIGEQQQKMLQNAKMSALGEMAGGIAHEINSPLAVIQAKTAQLNRLVDLGTVDTPAIAEYTQCIEVTSVRIAKIVRGLKLFARDGGGDPFVKTEVATMVADLVELCRERLESTHIKLEVLCPSGLTLDCRPTELVQVLINLLGNSMDAVQGTERDWIRLEVRDKFPNLEIAITDGGPGIPPENWEKIMRPFFTTKDAGKGTGLGLSISKGIAEAHSGRLFLDTASPNTRFILEIPRAVSAESASRPPPEVPASSPLRKAA